MKLTQAARRFDHLECFDAYSPSTKFYGQIDLYDDSRRDGLTAQRRILSVAPDVVIPPRRCIVIGGDYWLVGEGNPDYYMDQIIRVKYIIQRAPNPATVRTMADTLANAAGLVAYAYKSWIKSEKEVAISSDMPNQYELFFATPEPVVVGQMVQLESRRYVVRAVHDSAGGMLAATADELPEPVAVTATFSQRTYDPLTDTYTTTPLPVNALRIRWQSHFSYLQQGVETYQPGDIVLKVLKADLPVVKAGDRVDINGNTFVVKTFSDEGDVWGAHLQNA